MPGKAWSSVHAFHEEYPGFNRPWHLQLKVLRLVKDPQTEGVKELLEDGELLRQMFARFGGIPLFVGAVHEKGTIIKRRRLLS